MRRHDSAKTHLGVTGQMHPGDAAKVGHKLANAALIAAISGAGLALAAIIAALPWEHLLP